MSTIEVLIQQLLRRFKQNHSDRHNEIINVRLILILLTVFICGNEFVTINIDNEKLDLLIKNRPFLLLIDFLGGGALRNGSIFTISILFYYFAYGFVSILTLLSPSYNRFTKEGEYGKKKLDQKTDRIGIFFALAFSALLTSIFASLTIINSEFYVFIKIALFYFLGGIILFSMIKIIKMRNLPDGLLFFFVMGFLISIIKIIINGIQEHLNVFEVNEFSVVIILFIISLIISIILSKYKINVPVIYSAQQMSKSYTGKGLNIPLVPLSPFGYLRQKATLFLLFICYLFDVLLFLSYRTDNSFLKYFIGIGCPIFLAGIYSLTRYFRGIQLVHIVVNEMKVRGGFIKGVKPGKNTEVYLMRKAILPLSYEIVFLFAGLVIIQLLNMFLPFYIHPVSFVASWAVVEFFSDSNFNFYVFKQRGYGNLMKQGRDEARKKLEI